MVFCKIAFYNTELAESYVFWSRNLIRNEKNSILTESIGSIITTWGGGGSAIPWFHSKESRRSFSYTMYLCLKLHPTLLGHTKG